MKAEKPDPAMCRARYENDPIFHRFVRTLLMVVDNLGYEFKDLNQAIWTASAIKAEQKINKYGGI